MTSGMRGLLGESVGEWIRTYVLIFACGVGIWEGAGGRLFFRGQDAGDHQIFTPSSAELDLDVFPTA